MLIEYIYIYIYLYSGCWNYRKVYPGDVALKFEAFSRKQWRNPTGEIILDIDRMIPGEETKKWVKLKAIGDKRKKKQMVLFTITFIDHNTRTFVELFSDPTKEEEALRLYTSHSDIIRSTTIVRFLYVLSIPILHIFLQ